jgi:hypothetical protein
MLYMKPWLLLLTLSATAIMAQAAPARKVTRPYWEYALLDLTASRPNNGKIEYGVLLCLPGKKVFLSVDSPSSPEYKSYILNRLGIQGWELVTAPGYSGNQHYIFKRSK